MQSQNPPSLQRRSVAIGIDLAWSPRNPTGLAAADVDEDKVVVTDCRLAFGTDEIVRFVADTSRGYPTTIGIDCPTIVPNATGMRPCEVLLHRRFGSRSAGPYPANRSRLGKYNSGTPRGEEVSHALQMRLGAVECGLPPARHDGVHIIEVFPAPALVALLALPKAIAYKKKRGRSWQDCRSALRRFLGGLRALEHPACILPDDLVLGTETGRRYKNLEDQVDGVLCAYVAALAWLDSGRVEVFGDVTAGYVVVPTEPTSSGNARRPAIGKLPVSDVRNS